MMSIKYEFLYDFFSRFIVGDATHPVIDYIVDEKRYYIHVGDTDEAPEGVAMDALPVQHQFLPLPYFRRTPAELATEFIKIPLPKEGPLYDAMYAVCVFFGYKTPPADASGKETKTFVIYVTYLYMLLPIRIVCGQLPNPSWN